MNKVLVRWRAVFVLGMFLTPTAMLLGSSAQAQSSAPILNAANEHFYEAVTVSGGIDWFDARDAAELQSFWGVQGHLVTITSGQEDNFIATNFPEAFPVIPSPRPAGCADPITVENTCGYPYWFGGFQSPGSPDEPEGNWQWVTGEPFVYANWHDGEPNDFQGREEDCLNPHPDGSLGWNDHLCDDRRVGGYVIEYDISIPGGINNIYLPIILKD